MIDLHLHTTASDGRCSPALLVEQAAAAGLTIIAVTDHDTVGVTAEIAALCADRGLRAITGIEITAVEESRDVHVLGYGFDPSNAPLLQFLERQRAQRVDRMQAIAATLASLGMPIDISGLLAQAQLQDGRSIGRPQVAFAMVAAGHVGSVNEAFAVWLGLGRPAFIPRVGVRADRVIGMIHGAGGLASLAHPGQTRIDATIPSLREAGLDAIEAYHSDHAPDVRERYCQLASDLGCLVTGGSDYHGDPERGVALGSVTLPQNEWRKLEDAWRPHSSH